WLGQFQVVAPAGGFGVSSQRSSHGVSPCLFAERDEAGRGQAGLLSRQGNRPQAIVDQHEDQQQGGATTVVRYRHGQRQVQQHVARAEADLHGQRQQQQAGQAAEAGGAQAPGQQQQDQAEQHGPQSVGHVDGGAG